MSTIVENDTDSLIRRDSQVEEEENSACTIIRTETIIMAVENITLNTDKGTILQDVADLEYDEEFASLVVDQNNLGKFEKVQQAKN